MTSPRIATRRDFLTQGLGLVGVGAVLPNFLVHTALAAPTTQGGDQRVLVLVELNGGHDGPSALVPYALEGYHRLRKVSRITEREVIRLNDEVGLHPNLQPFKALFDQGSFAAVPGCGYPNPNYSHGEAMYIWHTGDPTRRRNILGGESGGRTEAVGWIGRYADHAFGNVPDAQPSIAVGSGRAPWLLEARHSTPLSISDPASFSFRRGQNDPLYQRLNAVDAARQNQIADLEYITHTVMQANSTSQRIQDAASRARSNSANYPGTSLGNALRIVGALIGGGLGTRVFFVRQSGYDTHSNQRPAHNNLMADLANSLAAFQRDLTAQGNANRVLSMTFSEFGRTVAENNSQGTDHGSAGPVFLIGPGVKAGVHGKHPSYDNFNPQGHFIPTHDYRRVYAAILEKWLGVQSRPIIGPGFEPLDCIA